jgi:hypothetical protein
VGKTHRAAVKENIISHKTRDKSIELPLTPDMEPGETLDIFDPKRGVEGKRRIMSVCQSYIGTETKTWVNYGL